MSYMPMLFLIAIRSEVAYCSIRSRLYLRPVEVVMHTLAVSSSHEQPKNWVGCSGSVNAGRLLMSLFSKCR